ncbi:hypothetical protein SAMN05216311_10219 [Chitinophaga sp. CF418]|nr:hypothetical protein SAMN05216311_10219 [Chitinophaga sp. CF418]
MLWANGWKYYSSPGGLSMIVISCYLFRLEIYDGSNNRVKMLFSWALDSSIG